MPLNEKDIFYLTVKGSVAGAGEWLPKTRRFIDTVLSEVLYKAKEYIDKNSPEKEKINKSLLDLDDRLSTVEDSNLQSICTDIGIPIFERLSYVSSEEIREIYVRMLEMAARKDKVDGFHPRHLEYLSSLSITEINFLKELVISKHKTILIQEHIIYKGSAGTFIKVHDVFPKSFEKNNNIGLILDNVCSLGILKIENKQSIALGEEFTEYLEKFFIKTPKGLRYNRETSEFENVKHVIPADADYDHVTFQGCQYTFTIVGYYFMELIYDSNKSNQA